MADTGNIPGRPTPAAAAPDNIAATAPDPAALPALPAADPLANGDPLAQLRDIHLPDGVAAFPPAPGWWLLAALLLGAAIWLGLQLWHHHRSRRYRREALAELARLRALHDTDSRAWLAAVADLLKRVALTAFPRQDVANRTGEDWVAFLDSTGDGEEFSMGAGQILMFGQYQEAADVDADALERIARNWIRRHRNDAAAPPWQRLADWLAARRSRGRAVRHTVAAD